jgi:hypothetical protein
MALALINGEAHTQDVEKTINWLAASKDPNGTWGYNTQATVLALKAFLKAATMQGSDTAADVRVLLDGKEIGARHFDNFNREVVWSVELSADQVKRHNVIELQFTGMGSLGYQVVSTHFVPWGKQDRPAEPLTISLSYDRNRIKVDETVKATAVLTKNDADLRGMVLVSLGIPPGFDVLTEDLDLLKSQKAIASYELTGRQVIVYLNELPAGESWVVEYRLKARYPVKAQTGESEVRMYYRGDVRSTAAPGELIVE